MEEAQPGFRFYPTEEELVSFYLQNKLEGRILQQINRVIPVVPIYDFNPWDLPQFAGECCPKDNEQWFFFIPKQEKEARGGRPNRLTPEGYWKVTGSPGYVYSYASSSSSGGGGGGGGRIIGAKRSMVFYKGRSPNGRKTKWRMNEYKSISDVLQASSSSSKLPPKLWQELRVCRVYIKSKGVRAFDRRPPPPSPPPPCSHGKQQELQTSVILSAERRTDSSSSSADDSHEVLENGVWNFPDDNSEPLWDWENLLMN